MDSQSRGWLPGIDIAKGLAILSVLALHSLTVGSLLRYHAVFHIWQAVPVFVGIMAYNTALSLLRRRPTSFSDLYSRTYLAKRFHRLAWPWAFAYFPAAVAAVWLSLIDHAFRPYVWPQVLAGIYPTGGPGGYFVTLALVASLMSPLLYWVVSKWATRAVVACFSINLAFELAMGLTDAGGLVSFAYTALPLRYLALMSLTTYLAIHPQAIRRGWFLAGVAGSTMCLLAFDLAGWTIGLFRLTWQPQTLLASFYPAALVGLSAADLRLWSNWSLSPLAALGRASYHVFLMQIIYFGSGASRAFVTGLEAVGVGGYGLVVARLVGDTAICIGLGLLLQATERRAGRIARLPGLGS